MASHLDLEEQEQLDQLKAFWKQWGNLITWVITAALLAFAGWQGWNKYQSVQAAQASAKYDLLDQSVQAGDADKAAVVFEDLKSHYGSSAYAAQAALATAKVQLDKGQADKAAASLAWAADNAGDDNYRDIARLRLAGLQITAKQFDAAAKTLDAIKSSEFTGLVADRRGDLLLLQNKPAEARAEFQKALAALDKTLDYRRLVEAKLATLGVATAEEAGK